MINDALLKKIRYAFNLNIYEAKILVALLSRGAATAGELSDMGNVPRSRAYDVLESLEKRGFVVMKLGRPIKYLAVSPEEILRRVKKNIEVKKDEEITTLEGVKKSDVFQELALLFKQGINHIDPSSIAGSFKGRGALYDHILGLISNAKKNVIIATTDKGLIRKVELLKTTLRRLKQNGVKVKIAAPLKLNDAKEAANELGEYAKVKPLNLNSRFVVVDEKDLVFMVNHDDNIHDSSDVGIWVESQFFSSSLVDMFESLWVEKWED